MKSSPASSKTVIVTGAANGLGRAIATKLAREGWAVVAVDRDAAGLEALALPWRDSGRFVEVVADVAVEADIVRTLLLAWETFGRLDAIVSNAGISEFKALADCTLEDWNRVLAVNLTPAFLLARGAEQALRASRGALILISSTRAHMSEPDTHAYSASKGGLTALTHSLAISLGPEVRVNAIVPGWIQVDDTPLSAEDHAWHPVGRVGKPEDVAAAVSFLLSAEAGFITGTELVLDGGVTRKMVYP